MPFAPMSSTIRLAATASFLATLTMACWGQEEPPAAPTPQNTQNVIHGPVVDFTKPASHFPNPIAPYKPRSVAEPNLANTSRIDSLMKDGKLSLSLNDAIALALENNLDIAIQRYNLNIADTDVLRAKAGAQILGTPTGIVQNTPGGGVGGIGSQVGTGTGGTSLGAGGAGVGVGGIVGSTAGGLFGPLITSFDPEITGTFQSDHASFIPTSPFQGSYQGTTTANFQYIQGFHWGTNVSVGFSNSRATSNSGFQSVSPALNSNFQFKLTQHLLQGFGLPANTRFIRIAKNNRELSDVAFRLQIITTVDQIENMYWDLVYAYENMRVRQESLAFSQKTFSDTKKQVEIGSLAPIEAVRAQSTVAADEQSLTVAKTNLQLQQLIMKNALSRSLHDPVLANADVIPTSTMEVSGNEQVQPTEELVNQALQHRAELIESRIQLNSQEQSNKALRSALLPTLDAYAYYGGYGLGGSQNPTNLCGDPQNPGFGCTTPPGATSVSYSDTLHQLVNSTAPDKGIGLQLNIPLRNRAAQSVQIRGELEYRQQQKYQFGTSTTTAVLQTRSALATAESTLMSAMAAYEKSRVEMDRAVGTLLDHHGISIDDAAQGQVTHMPNVPYVAPRKELPTAGPETPNPPAQQ